IRIDYENDHELDSAIREQIRTMIAAKAKDADAVIISDYGYGVADPNNFEGIKSSVNDRKQLVVVDSRFRLSSFPNFTSATPNEDEVAELIREEPKDLIALESAASDLREQLGYEALLVTRGSQGMMLF